MNDREIGQMDMVDLVIDLCNNNLSELNSFLPFPPVYAELLDLRTEFEAVSIRQFMNSKGIAIDKKKRRDALAKSAFFLSTSLFSYAKGANLPELERRVKYTPTMLKEASEKELVGLCYQLSNEAADNLAGLAVYGIDGAWVTAFVAKIDDFLSFMDAPKNARAEKKLATEAIKRLIPEMLELLRTRLDPIMDLWEQRDRMLYYTYKGARKIIVRTAEKPDLKGKVTDPEGNPLKGLRVTIAGTQRKSFTTALGNFRFIRLADGSYTLIVKDGRKELARKTVTVPMTEEVVIIIENEQ